MHIPNWSPGTDKDFDVPPSSLFAPTLEYVQAL